jgi:hypothetical protein
VTQTLLFTQSLGLVYLLRIFSFQERGKKLKVQQFIAKQANLLFDEVLNQRNEASSSPPSTPDHRYAMMPPFHSFIDVDKKERTAHFFSVSPYHLTPSPHTLI